MLVKTANPALNAQVFQNVRSSDYSTGMTIQGTVNKTAISLAILVASATFTWVNPNSGLMIIGAIGGFIVAIITAFKKQWAPTTTPIYAALEGLFLGGISVMFNQHYPGIVIQAVYLTFGTLFALLMAYASGKIRVTENFKLGLTAATGGLFFFYMINFILGFFGMGITSVYGNGIMGIGFSLIVVVIAALNLVLDFDFIEQGAQQGAPKYMEWYGAFGLMVTLIWLYIEILRLLAILQSRRD
ncbi:MAG: Bax inhibitor-1/YccA family protein [Candidatus Margulisiibacteriota bacterium]|nr:Bax inhibitor-1/YccA family protein [Candidatus Margulisiibacteriota bacterium]